MQPTAVAGHTILTLHLGEILPRSYLARTELALVDPFVYPGSGTSVAGVGWYETICLAALVRAASPGTIFEFGTLDGRTTLQLAANAPDATVYTLELPPGSWERLPGMSEDEREVAALARAGDYFRDTRYAERIVQLWGNSTEFDFSEFARAVDFVFVDASKDPGYFERDAENALRICSDRGVVVWHDYDNHGLFPEFDAFLRTLAETEEMVKVADTTLLVRMPRSGWRMEE
ncbi:MAG TPA: class I SAM-dependent methyltransferase [Longimicrobiaceae bacterium]|nr:class I SAM-dependent methyltransferase [Longimicrobiaceae bacterium]